MEELLVEGPLVEVDRVAAIQSREALVEGR